METPGQQVRQLAVFDDGFKDAAFGSIAGMVSKVFDHPFDLCKVRLQAQVLDHSARFRGPVDCLTQTWKNEGIRGLYRGLPAPVVGAMAENATLFLVYGQLQNIIRRWSGSTAAELSLPQVALAATGAGTIISFLLTPIELVKCKMQVQHLATESTVAHHMAIQPLRANPGSSSAIATLGIPSFLSKPKPNFSALPGPFAILRSIVQTHGLHGLWLGQTGTLIRETGGGAAWFTSKEAICSALLSRRARKLGIPRSELTGQDLKAWESAAAGAVAGVAYNIVIFPADSVKSALQTAEELRPPGPGEKAPTFIETGRAMFAKQGLKGLYAGMGITIARDIPSSAMIFLIYDSLNKRFG